MKFLICFICYALLLSSGCKFGEGGKSSGEGGKASGEGSGPNSQKSPTSDGKHPLAKDGIPASCREEQKGATIFCRETVNEVVSSPLNEAVCKAQCTSQVDKWETEVKSAESFLALLKRSGAVDNAIKEQESQLERAKRNLKNAAELTCQFSQKTYCPKDPGRIGFATHGNILWYHDEERKNTHKMVIQSGAAEKMPGKYYDDSYKLMVK